MEWRWRAQGRRWRCELGGAVAGSQLTALRPAKAQSMWPDERLAMVVRLKKSELQAADVPGQAATPLAARALLPTCRRLHQSFALTHYACCTAVTGVHATVTGRQPCQSTRATAEAGARCAARRRPPAPPPVGPAVVLGLRTGWPGAQYGTFLGRLLMTAYLSSMRKRSRSALFCIGRAGCGGQGADVSPTEGGGGQAARVPQVHAAASSAARGRSRGAAQRAAASYAA